MIGWRRAFFGMVAVVALAMPLAAEAQQTGKTWRIGFLGGGTAALFERNIEAIRLGLREHGYVEGRNITIEFRWAEGRYDRLPTLAAELVRLNVDVIITHGGPGTLALKHATSTVPIVMAAIGNAVEVGAVASLARPGGNITGASFFWEEIMAKRVDILKQALPRLARVGVLVNPESITYKLIGLRSLESLAQALNVKAQPLEVRRLDELDAALTLAKTQTDAVVVSEEILFYTGGTPRRIADLAIRSRMPSVGFTEYAEPGGLIGYGVDFFDLWRRSMTFVDKILRGANPADLPVEQPTKFELVINLKTAKALGVTIPPLVLARADRVIE
jgi:putative tryptophan/tyrosine transport system substrate-binding protein